jgi:hypothetical protein
VWPFFVVHPKPLSAELANLLEIFKYVGVKHFFTEGSVVALDERVLIRLAGLNVTRLNAAPVATQIPPVVATSNSPTLEHT